jgi:hypothetical protein
MSSVQTESISQGIKREKTFQIELSHAHTAVAEISSSSSSLFLPLSLSFVLVRPVHMCVPMSVVCVYVCERVGGVERNNT